MVNCLKLLTLSIVIFIDFFVVLINQWLEEQLDLVRFRVKFHQEWCVVVLDLLKLRMEIVFFFAVARSRSLRSRHLREVKHEDDVVAHDGPRLIVHLVIVALLLQQRPVLHEVNVEEVDLLVVNL